MYKNITMVYVFKKKIGDKYRYYLRLSKRNGSKVITKDIAYLGDNISDVKEKLLKVNKYSEEIRKSYRKINLFLKSNYYLEKAKERKFKKDVLLADKIYDIEACHIHFKEKILTLDNKTREEIFKDFITEFTYNTTSIEGNTISLEESRLFLEEGFTPKNKTLREIFDIRNSRNVFINISKYNISHKLIQRLHRDLMIDIDNRFDYRQYDIRVFKSKFESSPAIYVKTDMNLLLRWYEQNKNKMHPFVLAIIFHHKFEKIHPFMDGNGRTGRMLLNIILMNFGYPPLILSNKSRIEYLESLSNADNGNYTDLIKFSCDNYIYYYWNIFL
jgi:Fic family protein